MSGSHYAWWCGILGGLEDWHQCTPGSDALLEPDRMPVLEARRSTRADVHHQMSNPSLNMILCTPGPDALLEPDRMSVLEARRSTRADVHHQMSITRCPIPRLI
ncbi:hypothetical protein DY000_02020033 [Brassica cretica]|uniref:Uncharacterized protein n=1 Tax=Brassica cretica TaxID=69181 RepID=A0ABQ7EJA8_BRACR|nr:hypothetical protein DY000_02020033 [Brassica cretica]